MNTPIPDIISFCEDISSLATKIACDIDKDSTSFFAPHEAMATYNLLLEKVESLKAMQPEVEIPNYIATLAEDEKNDKEQGKQYYDNFEKPVIEEEFDEWDIY